MRTGLLALSALMALASVGAVSSGCTEPAPPACQAYTGCLLADDSPYQGVAPYQELYENREALRVAYGHGGECWRFGASDPLYQRCLEGCLVALEASCEAHAEGLSEAFCIDPGSPEPAFDGKEGGRLLCTEVAAELEALRKEEEDR